MRRTSADIRRRLDALREQVRAEEAALIEASTYERLATRAAGVYRRMQAGAYVVEGAGARLWWCRDGRLEAPLDADELTGLRELTRQGVVYGGRRRLQT